MKTLINFRSLIALLAFAAMTPVAINAQVRPTFYGQPALDRSAEVDATDVDPALARIIELAQNGLDWSDEAAKAGFTVQHGRVLVEMADAPSLGVVSIFDIAEYEAVFSGDPTRGRAWIDPASTNKIGGMRVYRQPVANSFGANANEAEEVMLANIYAASGLTGQGVRLAVIDIGFGGLDSSDEVGLVQRTQADLEFDASSHGTAMIEAIRDIASDAEISAIRLDANMDIIGATNLAISMGADIIVCPLSWFGLPNQGQACEAAAIADNARILWINAAGNFADRRYFEGEPTQAVQIGADYYVDFGTDPYQFINGMEAGDAFSVHFATEGNQQLELFSWDGMSPNFVLIGQGQAGSTDQVVAHVYEDGMYYFPMVRQSVAGEVSRFRMFAVGGDLHFNGAQGSIANPAAMPGVISVGAVSITSYGEHSAPETYSSMGGGIFNLTLTLCGPTGCTTTTYGPQGFSGTSAASANIAGLMALQLADPALSADALGFMQHIDIGGAEIVLALVDGHELDNDGGSAHELGNAGAISEGHLASPAADQDWFSFSLDAQSLVTISAPGCTIEVIALDAVDKPSIFSKRSEQQLNAGNYLVRVTADQITSYDLELQIVPVAEVDLGVVSIVDADEKDPGDAIADDEVLTLAILSAGQPQQAGIENAAGCAGSQGATGLAAVLATMILATAIFRTRRKHA